MARLISPVRCWRHVTGKQTALKYEHGRPMCDMTLRDNTQRRYGGAVYDGWTGYDEDGVVHVSAIRKSVLFGTYSGLIGNGSGRRKKNSRKWTYYRRKFTEISVCQQYYQGTYRCRYLLSVLFDIVLSYFHSFFLINWLKMQLAGPWLGEEKNIKTV